MGDLWGSVGYGVSELGGVSVTHQGEGVTPMMERGVDTTHTLYHVRLSVCLRLHVCLY